MTGPELTLADASEAGEGGPLTFLPELTERPTEARRRGLPCRFRPGEALPAIQAASGHPRDAAVCVGLGRAIGTQSETVARLRAAARPGGLLLPEDGCLRQGVSVPLQQPDPHREGEATIAELGAHGDPVVGERLAPKAGARAHTARGLDGLEARAEAQAARRPDLRGALDLRPGGQAMPSRLLEAALQRAAWVLRRGER